MIDIEALIRRARARVNLEAARAGVAAITRAGLKPSESLFLHPQEVIWLEKVLGRA